MAQFTPNTPHPVDLARRVAVFPAVKQRRKAFANIWFFDSPKNGMRHIVTGDLQFMSFVLLEGALSCLRYEPQPKPILFAKDGVCSEITAGAYVYRSDKSTEWWDFRLERGAKASDLQSKAAQRAAEESGKKYVVRTAGDVKGKAILFDNWLNICAGINRCRGILLHRELTLVVEAAQSGSGVTVGELLASEADHSCMFAAIALSLHRGLVCTDLERRLLGTDSILLRSTT